MSQNYDWREFWNEYAYGSLLKSFLKWFFEDLNDFTNVCVTLEQLLKDRALIISLEYALISLLNH